MALTAELCFNHAIAPQTTRPPEPPSKSPLARASRRHMEIASWSEQIQILSSTDRSVFLPRQLNPTPVIRHGRYSSTNTADPSTSQATMVVPGRFSWTFRLMPHKCPPVLTHPTTASAFTRLANSTISSPVVLLWNSGLSGLSY